VQNCSATDAPLTNWPVTAGAEHRPALNMVGLAEGDLKDPAARHGPLRPAVKTPLFVNGGAAGELASGLPTAAPAHIIKTVVNQRKTPAANRLPRRGWEGRRQRRSSGTPRLHPGSARCIQRGERIPANAQAFVGVVAIAMAHGIHQGLHCQAQMQIRQIADLAMGPPSSNSSGGRGLEGGGMMKSVSGTGGGVIKTPGHSLL